MSLPDRERDGLDRLRQHEHVVDAGGERRLDEVGIRFRHEEHDRCLRLQADHCHLRLEESRGRTAASAGSEQHRVDALDSEVRNRVPYLGCPGDDVEPAARGVERLVQGGLAVEGAGHDDPERLLAAACGERGHLLPPASTVVYVSVERLLSFGFLTGRSCSVQSPFFIT